MKTFITSLIIFIILLSILIVNCIYICRFTEEFDSVTQRFEEDSMDGAKETFEELDALWSKNELIITLTNDHTKIQDIESGLLKMEAAILAQNYALYTEARLTLLRVKNLLREYDTFSWEGLM